MEDINSDKRNTLTLVLFAIYLLALTWLILFKLQFSIPSNVDRMINLIPFLGSFNDKGAIRFSEIRVNILVFIPLGIYIYMLKAKLPFVKKVLAIFVLTLAFEITQFVFAIGRSDITDVLSNAFGGVIGLGIYALLSKVLKGRTNKVLNVLAAVFTISALFLAALLLVSHRWVMIR